MKISKHILATAAFLFFSCAGAMAQTAISVINATADKLKNSGGIEASFEGTTFKGKKVASETTGEIRLQGTKFRITTPALTTWFDGHTQWTLMTGSNEVNVSTPTEAELQQINPYNFINLYKKGYNLTLETATYQGTPCHEVRLKAQNKNAAISQLILTISKKTGLPLSVRMKSDKGEWTRLRVNSIKTNQKWKDNTFRFNEKQYPDIEIIDLR